MKTRNLTESKREQLQLEETREEVVAIKVTRKRNRTADQGNRKQYHKNIM